MTDEFENLQARIQQVKSESATMQKAEKEAKGSGESNATQTGIRAVTDLVGTPIVCGGIGIGLDNWFKTGPVLFIIMAILGLITGFWNLNRLMNGQDSSVGFKRLQNKEKEGNKAQLSGKDLDH